MKDLNALTLAHQYIKRYVRRGSICIDATAGRGNDTVFLADLVGDEGRVCAFDIQKEALDSTKTLLTKENLLHRAELILDSHSHMSNYFQDGTVDCVCFNFGWLPGGNHSIFTQAHTSIAAINAALALLKVGGIISLCIYSGKDCGFAEKEAIMDYLPTIDFNSYSVLITSFANRPNNPPIPVFIMRDE